MTASLFVVLALALLVRQVLAEPTPPLVWRSLADEDVLPSFERRLCDILRDSEPLEKRQKRITVLLEEAQATIGLPTAPADARLKFEVEDVAPRTGTFVHEKWTLRIDEQVLVGGRLTAAQKKQLVRTLIHELRHPEQYWRVICWLIDSDQTGGLNLIKVPQPVFTAAYQGARQGTRPRVEGVRAEEAKAWWAQWLVAEHRKRKWAFEAAARRLKDAREQLQGLRQELASFDQQLAADRAQRKGPETPVQAAEQAAAAARRRQLVAACARAEKEEREGEAEFERARKECVAIPLESDIARLLAQVTGCDPV